MVISPHFPDLAVRGMHETASMLDALHLGKLVE